MTMISLTDGTAFVTDWSKNDVVVAWKSACEMPGRPMNVQGVYLNPVNIVAVYDENEMENFVRPGGTL